MTKQYTYLDITKIEPDCYEVIFELVGGTQPERDYFRTWEQAVEEHPLLALPAAQRQMAN